MNKQKIIITNDIKLAPILQKAFEPSMRVFFSPNAKATIEVYEI